MTRETHEAITQVLWEYYHRCMDEANGYASEWILDEIVAELEEQVVKGE